MGDTDISGVIALATYVCYFTVLLQLYAYASRLERPISDSTRDREEVRQELIRALEMSENARDIIRMGPDAFRRLVHVLRGRGLLRDNQYSTVEEQVAKFLHMVGCNVRNRTIRFFFCRSSETISRHFHQVLRALIRLEDQFLIQPNGSTIPPEILHSGGRYYPYFKNCIGAIDGTHIRIKASRDQVARYRGRKGFPTMNVLAACTFDLRFTYVLPGWEGSASDSRVLENALDREDSLKVPQGKFYLADAGYMLRSGFITPYRSTRYHLKEFSRHGPENARELFNLRHASLRNAIERIFGVLKKRFPIIASGAEAHYDVDTVSEILLACCILHNFLMGVDPDEELIAEVDRELARQEPSNDNFPESIARSEDGRRGDMIRGNIATQMWEDYIARRGT